MMHPYIKVEALCKWCTNQPMVWREVCIHFHPKSHFCFGTLLVNNAALVSTTATAAREYCSASRTLHCTTFRQMFLARGASGQEHTLHNPSSRNYYTSSETGSHGSPFSSPIIHGFVATVKDSRGKFFSPNCGGKMHKRSWRQCSRWQEHSFFRSQCPYKLNELDKTLMFCFIGNSFKRKRLPQNPAMDTEKRIRIIACKHKTAHLGYKIILGSKFSSAWCNAKQ